MSCISATAMHVFHTIMNRSPLFKMHNRSISFGLGGAASFKCIQTQPKIPHGRARFLLKQ
jgi:hypothetical protein